MDGPYPDTSALAKWYLNERPPLLARRRRAKEITALVEGHAFSTFENDIRAGFLVVQPLEDAHAVAAVEIVARLKAHPLRRSASRSFGSTETLL